MTRPICLWSGPRNVSTALMYSFAQLPGVAVVDEPLYGHYLQKSGAEHPGREEIVAAMNCDGNTVMREVFERQNDNPTEVLFIKNMAHHLVDLELEFLSHTNNIFLIRDPREMLPSLTIQLPDATLADTGLARQWELYRELSDAGQAPAIVDSRELLLNPESVLRQLCSYLGVEFTGNMLNWDAGARPEDGLWAKYWYDAVHKSTGFAPYTRKTGFPEHLQTLLDECSPFFDKLYKHALRAN